ncbi:ATP-binding cassette domain-containing protein, partial [Klebsiella pneumoniae]
GSIIINGKEVSINSPQDAIREGIGYLSEDRKRFGCIVDMTIANNTVITNLDKYIKAGLIDDGAIVKASDQFVQSLHTKTPSSKQLVRNLSGGNQQKVVIAKWLEQNSDILIFDEPTRGIDVGAKSEIYTLMN